MSLFLAASLCTLIFAGCGNKESSDAADAASSDAASSGESSGTLTIATNFGIHEEVLNQAAPLLAEEGIELVINSYDDYFTPNLLVDGGEADANYFQHEAYLESFNLRQDTNLVSVGEVHFEPIGIYPGEKDNLSGIAEGDIIVIPNDESNEKRALKLLENVGIIKLAEGGGLLADIQSNPYGVSIVPAEASLIPSMAQSAAFLVMNGNYARDAFYSVTEDALAYENAASDDTKPYWNVIAVNSGNEEDWRVQKLVEILQSDEIKDYINNTYDGTAVAD